MPEIREALALGLCGSVARGTAGPDSDIDVLVVLPDGHAPAKQEDRWWRAVRRALAPLGREVSVLVYTPRAIRRIGNWYVLRLASDSLLLHDTNGQIDALLRRVRDRALATGFVERDGGGRPYWEYVGDASKPWELELAEP
ncbi:MAG: nucleotidyltransferase domain-containing protein [Deltaproteobacteria bacterium]|nr:nucleotidyltransferase domain-containing protein [Deltaproteobacteria bacterium]